MEFLVQDLLDDTLTIFLAIATFLFITFYFLVNYNKSRKQKSPPEAGGAWPIIGHLRLFTGSNLPHVELGNMADKYGPAFAIRIGTKRVLIVSNWKLAKELLTTHDIIVSSRPMFQAAKHLSYNYVMFGFSPYGSYWRDIRKLVSIALLSNRRLDSLKHIRDYEIEVAIRELYEVWSSRKGNYGSVLVEMKQLFGRITLNVMLRMMAGKRLFGTKNIRDEAEGQRFQKVLRDFIQFLGVFVPADALPLLGWFDIGGYERAMKQVAKDADLILNEWLLHHRRRTNEAEDEDFMDKMISLLQGQGGFVDDSVDVIIKSSFMALISGGADTTMVMLTWALSLIMNNPRVLSKVQEELDEVVGKERRVNESDINSLVYLRAVVKETLRLYPAAPLSGPRMFDEDCTVFGFHVPKGTWLLFNLWKLQRDQEIWSDPLEFKPERFIDDDSKRDVDVIGHDFELIPFGAGRRICPGVTFGVQMMHLVLANLLHCFDISTMVANGEIDMTESVGLTNIKATPLEVLISPRLSPHLY